MLDYTTYSKEVENLAFYPYAKQKNVASLIYPVLGLNGEASEVLEKIGKETDKGNVYTISKNDIPDILKEIGDVLWYITRVAAELNSSLEEICLNMKISDLTENVGEFDKNCRAMSVSAGQIAEITKKTLRDDGGDILVEINGDRRTAILEELTKTLLYLVKLSANLGASLDDVAIMNIEKLLSRRDRNALHGSGDNR